jgi:hypothetical protein
MYDNVIQNNMKKDKRIILRIDDDLYLFLEKKQKMNRTNISHEVRQIILEKFNEEKNGK